MATIIQNTQAEQKASMRLDGEGKGARPRHRVAMEAGREAEC